jgi:hypothetical protein
MPGPEEAKKMMSEVHDGLCVKDRFGRPEGGGE